MRILLVYPQFAEALWAYKHALEYIGKAASSPPLGLLTVAAMLPPAWEKRLIDLNTAPLTDGDLLSADYVFVSAMLAQQNSTNQIISRCRKLGIPTVAGGPLFSFPSNNLELVEPDHTVRGEAETLMGRLLADLEVGNPRAVYESRGYPDLALSPVPLWELVDNPDAYTMMTLQFARGCPHDCEFCDVVALNGRKPRWKTINQIAREMDALYHSGWRGHVFVCDDNLIGNPRLVRESVLPMLIDWMTDHGHPFTFSAAVSIDLANHPDIMDMMAAAGFERVTIGIESPNIESLQETNKLHNIRGDMLASVHTIQAHGLEVQAGFIVGFDHDPPSIFDQQIDFIQASGIATAMLSILFAFPGARLYARLQHENRLLPITVSEHAYGAVSFEPQMGIDRLRSGHLQALQTIYAPEQYHRRLMNFLAYYHLPATRPPSVQMSQLWLLLRIIWDLGVADHGRAYFWRLVGYGLRHQIRALPTIIRLLVTGYNFRKDIAAYRSASDGQSSQR